MNLNKNQELISPDSYSFCTSPVITGGEAYLIGENYIHQLSVSNLVNACLKTDGLNPTFDEESDY